MRARLLLLIVPLLLLISPVFAYQMDLVRTISGHGTLSDGTHYAAFAYFKLKPVMLIRLVDYAPADIYVIRCPGMCTPEYVKEKLTQEFAPGVLINPRIPVYDDRAYVPVFAAIYEIKERNAVEVNFALARLVVGNEILERNGVDYRVLPSGFKYSKYFTLSDGKTYRLMSTLGLPPVESVAYGNEYYYFATDGFAFVDGISILENYKPDSWYHDSCINFDHDSAVVLLSDTNLELFECRPVHWDLFEDGHNYQDRTYVNFVTGWENEDHSFRVTMWDLSLRPYGKYFILYGADRFPDVGRLEGNVVVIGEESSPSFVHQVFNKGTEYMLLGIAGAEAFVETLDIMEEFGLGMMGGLGLFLLGGAITYLIIRAAYEFVRSRNPKLIPLFWFMVFMFGDVGAIVTAILAALF